MKVLRPILTALALSLPISAAALEDIDCPTEQMRIVVIGDAFADGLSEALERGLERCTTIDIVALTAVSQGLVRSSAQDWLERYTGTTDSLLETDKTDLVLVQMGINDLAGLDTDTGRAEFGTEEWIAAYGDTVSTLTRDLVAQSARVIWLGLPVMGNQDRDAGYGVISETQASAAGAVGAEVLEIREMSQFGTDGYVRDAEVADRARQVRSSDQVRFTSLGYDLVGLHISDAIARFVFDRDMSVALRDDLLQ